MSQQELAYWLAQFNAEQAEFLPCSPDPEHDLDEAWEEELNAHYFASRGV